MRFNFNKIKGKLHGFADQIKNAGVKLDTGTDNVITKINKKTSDIKMPEVKVKAGVDDNTVKYILFAAVAALIIFWEKIFK